jgi:hypothetical protein
MPTETDSSRARRTQTNGKEPSQKELQSKIGQTRDSLRSTVETIQGATTVPNGETNGV